MANPIDIIITKEALAAIDLAIKKVDSLDKELAQTAQNFIDNSKKMAAAAANLTPSSVNNRGNDSAKLSADLDKLKTKYTQLHDSIAKKAEQSRLAELRLQQQREKAFDKFEQNALKEANAYNKTQRQINALTDAYNNLAVKKERNKTLNENEEKRLTTLTAVLNKYNGTLKTVDVNIGKSGRNVGNYSSGFNSLGNSVNQLTRELPAAAVSLNTFFLGISNNIAPIADEIKRIREQNKLLIAEGEKPVSTLKQLSGAVFGLQTLLSVSIALLTIYGADVIKWTSSLFGASKGLDAAAKAQISLNKAISDAQKDTADEITHLNLLNATAKDASLSMNTRKIAVKEMQELYPHYLGNLSEEAILTGQTSTQMSELAKNIMAAATARGIEQEISKKAVEDYKARKLLIGEINTDLVNYRKYLKTYEGVTNQAQKDAYILNAKVQFQTTRDRKLTALKALTDQQNAENEILVAGYKRQAELAGKLGPDGKDEADKKEKRVKEKRREDIEGLKSYLKEVGTINQQINNAIDRLQTEAILNADDRQHVEEINKLISRLTTLKNEVNKIDPIDVHIVRNPEEVKKQIREISQEMKNFTSSFRTEFFSSSGFGSLETFFNKEFDNLLEDAEGFAEEFAVVFNSIAEVGQEAFNFISQASQKNFESEKNRLQSQYDIAIKYAGDSKEAQEKLADDLEKRKAEIATREAKAKQKQAIVNIAIDTAQAIVAAWVNPGYPGAIALTAVLAGLGIAQAAIVSSQEIPQYWMGGTHDGGLMMVNDGKGPNYKETIVTPDGKIMKPQGRNVILDAPAGTEIYTHDQWNDKLAEMLQGKGIDMAPMQNNYSGLSKNDMYDVLSDTLGMQPQYHSNFDAEGATTYILKRGNKTIDLTRRGNSGKLRFK